MAAAVTERARLIVAWDTQEGREEAKPTTVAFDPLTGRPTVAWAARPNGVDRSMGVGRTAVLSFATREAP